MLPFDAAVQLRLAAVGGRRLHRCCQQIAAALSVRLGWLLLPQAGTPCTAAQECSP
jgi:hypothetical protein